MQTQTQSLEESGAETRGLDGAPQDLGGTTRREPERAGLEIREDATSPHRIARFAVLNKLGEGGMGVVYSAYDDELDRKVAIKLLRSRLGAHGRRRMVREAQALAQLSHPNVVHVYEAGALGDQIFVAMEFVRGQTLARWGREHRRTRPSRWRERLPIILQAGRGLAAVHAAGLVHRDFKPHNVIVGDYDAAPI